MRRTLLTLGGVVMLLATACASSHPATTPTTASTPLPATTVPTVTAPAPTTIPASTTTVPDIAVVPARITVAYVDAVLANLNHVYGDAVRAGVAAGRVTPKTATDLNAIYSTPLGAEERSVFAETLAGGLANVRHVPGDPITSVQRLIYASTSCIYARVETNLDAVVIKPVPLPADEFVGLSRFAGPHTSRINSTPWFFFFDLVNRTPTNVPNQCPVS